jgi:hypothetical protein
MSKEKYCPMMFAAVGAGLLSFKEATCYKEKSQWWNIEIGDCAVSDISNIAAYLAKIRDEFPEMLKDLKHV